MPRWFCLLAAAAAAVATAVAAATWGDWGQGESQ